MLVLGLCISWKLSVNKPYAEAYRLVCVQVVFFLNKNLKYVYLFIWPCWVLVAACRV